VPPILIDISRLLYRRLRRWLPTGIDRVSLEYIRHYADRARAVLTLGPFSSVLSIPDSAQAFRMLLDPCGKTQATKLISKAYLRWWLGADAAGCVLFNTSHTGLDNAGYAKGLARKGALPVFVVCDLIPITHPEYCRPGDRERHVARMRNAVTTARGIVTISRDTLEALRGFAGEAGLRMPPTVVAALAPSLPHVEPGPRPIAAPYFVVVGTIEPRKNHILLLHLWRSLVEQWKRNGRDSQDSGTTRAWNQRHDGSIPRLVIIGQRGWECENIVDLLERCESLRGYVLERGQCSDAELVTYLRHAQALLFPSFVEGYGLPLAEALSLGTPAIAADLPVFREVAGEIPEYVDPLDGRRWMELIEDYADATSARRAAQIERIKGFQATTWQQHFQTVDNFVKIVNGQE